MSYNSLRKINVICFKHENRNFNGEAWQQHVAIKGKIRQEWEYGKEMARRNEVITISMDLQAVKTDPDSKATAIYFKLKWGCHNATFYNVQNHDCTCCWFAEVDANSCPSTFASCIMDYLKGNCLPLKMPSII